MILDNLGSHKGKSAREAIRAKGAHLLFLPPYSPDLNPIEQVFAKLKRPLRAAQPRDAEACWRKVGDLINLFAKDECANYHPGICWSGLRVNRSGSFVQALQMYS